MKYKLCPKCNLNFIKESEVFCEQCQPNYPFDKLKNHRFYGSNSKTIYEEFCKTFGWDKNKSNQFGWQKPLYAENVDGKNLDVWFICYPNFDKKHIHNYCESVCAVNVIQKKGEQIIEVVDDKFGNGSSNNRITFLRTDDGYIFLGVFSPIINGTTRVYQKISDCYPY